MKSGKKGVLLVNLGTPDSTSTKDVRKYLREFLMDGRVLDIPFLNRWFLVNLIIAPLRAPKSAAEYKKLWTEKGSPLMYLGVQLKELVQNKLGKEYVVDFAMRYQNPDLEEILNRFNNKGFEELLVVPLYPQYASASTGSTLERINEIVSKWEIIPEIKTIAKFPNHPKVIDAFVENAEKWRKDYEYDHYVFSYHGLPERQILKGSCDGYCKLGDCCFSYHSKNAFCYRAQCFETSRHLAEKLNITSDQYTVCFQSRLGKTPWIKPYTDDVIPQLAKSGKKKVLAFSPAFVADCLETTIEVGQEYKELFFEHGGERWDLVESLNTNSTWIEALEEMIKDRI